jgi:hypothetical protein
MKKKKPEEVLESMEGFSVVELDDRGSQVAGGTKAAWEPPITNLQCLCPPGYVPP